MEPPTKKIAFVKREAAKKRYLTYKNDAFLDYMLQANDEEKAWVITMIMPSDNSDNFFWEFDGSDLLMLIKRPTIVCLLIGRHGIVPKLPYPDDGYLKSCNFILKYPWIRRDDTSIDLLTRDALVCIFKYLQTAEDLFAVTRVSRLWYKAGTDSVLYEKKISRLLKQAHLLEPPFKDTLFRPHQYFFALLFKTCKTDKELATKILDIISKGNNELALYCRSFFSGWGWAPIHEDYTMRRQGSCIYLKNGYTAPEQVLFDGTSILDEKGVRLIYPDSEFNRRMYFNNIKF